MKDINLKLVKMEDIKFNDNLFIPIKTKTIVDTILSTEGGIFPGTNTVVIGDPGVGKSTVLLDWAFFSLQSFGHKSLSSVFVHTWKIFSTARFFGKFDFKHQPRFFASVTLCPNQLITLTEDLDVE